MAMIFLEQYVQVSKINQKFAKEIISFTPSRVKITNLFYQEEGI